MTDGSGGSRRRALWLPRAPLAVIVALADAAVAVALGVATVEAARPENYGPLVSGLRPLLVLLLAIPAVALLLGLVDLLSWGRALFVAAHVILLAIGSLATLALRPELVGLALVALSIAGIVAARGDPWRTS